MKYTKLFLLVVLFLASCAVPATSAPVPTQAFTPEPTATQTPIPTIIPTSTLTNTPSPTLPPGALNLRTQFNGIREVPERLLGPDVPIAVGRATLLLATNEMVAIVDKAGNLVAQKSMESFLAPIRVPGANRLTDPRPLYDSSSERFFLANSDGIYDPACSPGICVAQILLAVSRTSTPMTLEPEDWHFYALDRTVQKTTKGIEFTRNYGDFDVLAVVDNILAVSWDVDSYEAWLGPGGQVRFLDKEPLIEGTSIGEWIDVVGLPGHVALVFDDPGRIFLVGNTPSEYKIWAIDNPLTSPTTTKKSLTIGGSFSNPPDAAQPVGVSIDILEGPKTQSVYRNGSLWVSKIIGRNFGSGEVSAIQWAQIDVSGWPKMNVLQSGILGEDKVWYFAPAIMVDSSGNFAMVYARSSVAQFVSVYYTGRLASDPPGTLRPSGILNEGSLSYERIVAGRNRFVDYFGIALDPIDSSVWMFYLYPTGSDRSGTWVGNLDWSTVSGP